jgi:fatty acid desaturase
MMKTCVYLDAGCSLINTSKRVEMKSLRSFYESENWINITQLSTQVLQPGVRTKVLLFYFFWSLYCLFFFWPLYCLFFFWLLYCLFFFHFRIPITSNSSWDKFIMLRNRSVLYFRILGTNKKEVVRIFLRYILASR